MDEGGAEPTKGATDWHDLKPRILSAAVMVAAGLFAILAGGIWFQMLVALAAGLMLWEIWSMVEPDWQVPGVVAALAATAVLPAMMALPTASALILLLAIPAVLAALGPRAPERVGGYIAMVLVGSAMLLDLRAGQNGLVWVLWLILVVIASDVAGYFAGRHFGGPRFWPRISPKKTWSGTVAGWLAAALVGAIFVGLTGRGAALIPISILVAFAGQMGDIAQSALKRWAEVKDSSDLIPGHGGVYDRFDALLGASLAVILLDLLGLLAR